MTDDYSRRDPERPLKQEEVLSFKVVQRTMPLHAVTDEFRLMKSYLRTELTAQTAKRVCEKSGSHLLKMVSARTV